MIESIEIRNFQSLHRIDLELKPFTVIVGKSSSGKSAFVRALRTLAANRRGADFISHGERLTSISARTHRGVVTLTRGKGTADNSYTVIPEDPEHPLSPKATYTKLDGKVPPEVSAFLGIDPLDPITFAAQFDKPYLLDESAPEVARTLGALTNVHVIFEGARESNRRKLASSATLKTRKADLAVIQDKIPTYRSLKSQAAALTEAEQLIAEAYKVKADIAALTAAVEALAVTESRLEALRPAMEIEVPDERELVEASLRLQKFRDALVAQQSAAKATATALAALEAASTALDEAQEEYDLFVGNVSTDVLGFVEQMAQDPSRTDVIDGKSWIEVGYAAEIFTKFLETKAG